MRKLPKFCLIPLLLMCVVVQAQVRTVKGKVVATQTMQPVMGASVLVRGATTGTSTDNTGSFSLSVPNGKVTLVVTYVGYGLVEKVVNANVSDITIELSESGGQLGEVIVTALGISRQAKTLVYATQTIKPSELTEARDPNNVINSLQGKVANALITQGSGGPGSGVRIVLRGNRSIQQSNNALIVVDGVPITNGTNGTVTSDFGGIQGSDGASSINPDDIESMTVLRGASAAALYGSQAGNGVIVITTKKGKKDRASVVLNSGIAWERPFQLPALQNSYGQGNTGAIVLNTAGESIAGDSWGAKLDGHPIKAYNGESRNYSAEPDNIKDFFRTGQTLNNSIGVSGGSEKMQSYLSYSNSRVQGIMPKNDLERHTFNLRISNQVSKRFSTDAKVTYILQDIKSKYPNGESLSPIMDLYLMPRNVSLSDIKHFEDINNVGVPVPARFPSTNLALWENPMWIVNRTQNNEKRDRVMGFVSAKFDITNWLHITGRANLDKINDRLDGIRYQGTLGVSASGGGSYSRTLINVTQKWLDVMVDGTNKLTKDLKIDYRVGAILKDNKWDQLNNGESGLFVTNFFSLNFARDPNSSQGASEVQTQSVFGQVNLAYKEYLFLDASLRNEWDSRLPSPYSFTYPSVGLSAIISDMVHLPTAISLLKLSGNYAQVGNGGQEQIRFNTFQYAQGAGNGYINRSSTKAIEDLKPEIVKSIEFGVEAKFLNNKLGFQFTVYKSNSLNQLLRVSVPVATGFGDQYINAGDIQNKGLELVLNATPFRSKDLTWDVSFNLGMNRNKIVRLTPTIKSFDLEGFSRSATPIIKEGGSYGDMVGFIWMKHANGNYLVTPEGKPLSSITKDAREPIGNFNPQATLGLTNSVNYKGIFLRLLIDGRIGGTVVDGTEQIMAFNGISKGTENFREGGWNLGGVDVNGSPVKANINAQDYWTTASGGRYGSAEFFSYDATNFRIRELTLGYDIPLPTAFVVKAAKLSVVARNLLWLYRGSSRLSIPGIGKRKMSFDPDMSLGNSNWQGVSYGTFPATRSIGLNLQVTF
ncbi:MAG: SusC/RagA family TonB-linked outer membrane protein [Ferruginibacter sp.]